MHTNVYILYTPENSRKLRVTLGLSSLRCSPARLVLDYLQSAWILRFGCKTCCNDRSLTGPVGRCLLVVCPPHLCGKARVCWGLKLHPTSWAGLGSKKWNAEGSCWGHDWEIFAFYQYWQGPLLWHFAAQRVLQHATTWQLILQTWGFPEKQRRHTTENDKHVKLPNSHLWPMHHWSTWADGWAVFPITQHLLFQSFFTLLAIWARFSKTYCNLQSPVRFSNSVRRHWGL